MDHSFLTKGSQVEVSSDEDGLTGAWFVATVIHPPPSISSPKSNNKSRNNLVYVEYHNLLTEDGSSRRLREYANVACVRPSPQPDSNAPPPNFQLHDLVDAFYRDGWWTGVITEVVDSSKFVVTFQNPPDRIQFSVSDLRPHRKWVGGRWIQPENQRTAGLMFEVGKKVEVSFDREDLRDAWFPATVEKNFGNNSFQVDCLHPGIGNEPTRQKATVDCLHIRPVPPYLRDKNFVLLEKVDAFFDYGWWSGIITKELADSRYNVFFKHTKKQREFIYSNVRPHMEWKGGKWFNTSQGDADRRKTCSLMDKQIEQTTPSIGKQSTVATSLMKRTKQTDLDSNDKNSLPPKRLKDGVMSDDSSLSNMAPSKNTNGPLDDHSEGFDCEASVINDQAFGKTENLSHGKKVRSKRGKGIEMKTPATDSSRKERLATENRNLEALSEGAKGDSRSQENVEKEHVTKDSAHPVIIGLECNVMPQEKKDETQQPGVPSRVVDKEGKEGDAETVPPKRKRGRPPKLQASSPKTPVAVNHENGGVVPRAVSMVEVAQRKEVGSPKSRVTKPLEESHARVEEQTGNGGKQDTLKESTVTSEDTPPNETPEEDRNVGQGRRNKGRRVKQRTMSINTESPAQDASKEKADGKDSDGKSQDTMSDDQPLSRWFEGMQSPLEQSSERPLSSEKLLFVRSTPLWEAVESMEAFRKIPQKPHFRPLLEGAKESAWEGLAIGSMVTFSSVVERTRALKFDDARSGIEDCLETLVELESLGFDVEAVRERLTGLLLIKDKQEELEERVKGVGNRIEEYRLEGKKMDEEIGEIDRKIRELEERRRQASVRKDIRDSKMGIMKAARDEMEQKMRGVGAEFNGFAAAPLL